MGEKYVPFLCAALDAEQAVQEDKEERGGHDSGTVIRAWEAKKNGEWGTDDAIELVIAMLYADGEGHEEFVKKLPVLAKSTPLGHMDRHRIQGAPQYAVDRGRYKDLRRMYCKRRRRLDTDARGGL